MPTIICTAFAKLHPRQVYDAGITGDLPIEQYSQSASTARHSAPVGFSSCHWPRHTADSRLTLIQYGIDFCRRI